MGSIRRVERSDIAAVDRLRAPIGNHFGRDFGMAIAAVDVLAIAKCLVAALVGPGDPSAPREVKCRHAS